MPENDTRFNLRTLQERVGEWHREMFPDLPSPARVLAKRPGSDGLGSCLEDEVAELCSAEYAAEGAGIERLAAPEAADVVLCVLAYCDRRGIDLANALERKFEINRGRSRERVRR